MRKVEFGCLLYRQGAGLSNIKRIFIIRYFTMGDFRPGTHIIDTLDDHIGWRKRWAVMGNICDERTNMSVHWQCPARGKTRSLSKNRASPRCSPRSMASLWKLRCDDIWKYSRSWHEGETRPIQNSDFKSEKTGCQQIMFAAIRAAYDPRLFGLG